MASEVDIANLALTLLGQEPISDLSEDHAAARALNTNFDIVRDAELAIKHWRFAIKRTTAAALASAPEGNDFTVQFQLPNDFLAPVRFGDSWPGADLTDYRTGPNAEYSIEGDRLLCNYAAPLLIVYAAKITNTELFHPCFNTAFAAQLAYVCCEKITGSNSKQEAMQVAYGQAIRRAMAANAILVAPEFAADNSWMLARLG